MKSKEPEEANLKSKLDFQKFITLLLIFGLIIVSSFIIYNIIKPKSGYITFGILNSEKSAQFQKECLVGENVSLYVFIGNHLNQELNFRLEILKGDNNTYLALNQPTNGSSLLNITSHILNGLDWISNLINVSFTEQGTNKLIIAELWLIKADSTEYFYNSLYQRLNVTL
jgi:uncharacterized membrane protein